MSMFPERTLSSKKAFSLNQTVFTLFSVIFIRMFLESFSNPDSTGYLISWEALFLHAPLYFISIFLSLVLTGYLFTKKDPREIIQFLTPTFLFIIIPPLIDRVFKGSYANSMGGYIATEPNNIIKTYFELMNPLGNNAVTFSMHVASFLTFAALCYFIYRETKKISLTLTAALFVYSVFFLYALLPSAMILPYFLNQNIASGFDFYQTLLQNSWIMSTLEGNQIIPNALEQKKFMEDIIMSRIYWIFIVIQSFAIFILANKKLWHVLKSYLRQERIFNFILIASIGMILNEKLFSPINLRNTINAVTLLMFLILIALSAWLATLINDNEDIEIDKIANPSRPLVNNDLTIQSSNQLQLYLFMLLFFGIAAINRTTGFLLILAQALYYIYSTNPLRLKKHFLFSSILIGMSTACVAMAGFFLVSPDQHLSVFPLKALLILGVAQALLSNIKDVKDYEGDKHANIKTIPVVFGLKYSKYILASLYSLVFIGIPILLDLPSLLLLSISCSIFVFYLYTKKHYQEKYIFLLMFVYIFALYITSN